jgi:UDP-GlcNAc:undecaprenyl-phosphate GlcNAc-1-phosphate transferase
MNNPLYLKYTLFLLGSLIFAILINSLFLRFVKTLGIRNTSETIIRWSPESKPALGGITFYIVFLLSGAVYPLFFGTSDLVLSMKSIGILAATSLGFLMGLADDAYNTRPILKSITQLICALILISTGTQIELFHHDVINKLLTIIWVVGIMNSLNMLDNMDGITGIVSFFICVLIVIISIYTSSTPFNLNMIIASGVMTSLIAFLYFNWYPAKMYMGDSGSQFLGIALSALGIVYFWNPVNGSVHEVSLSKQFLLPVLAFLVPIIDTTTVTINRLQKGKSPFIGGKDHTTHYLSRFGLGDKRVAYAIGLISFVSSCLVLFICIYTENWTSYYAIAFLAYALLLFSILFYISRKKNLHP